MHEQLPLPAGRWPPGRAGTTDDLSTQHSLVLSLLINAILYNSIGVLYVLVQHKRIVAMKRLSSACGNACIAGSSIATAPRGQAAGGRQLRALCPAAARVTLMPRGRQDGQPSINETDRSRGAGHACQLVVGLAGGRMGVGTGTTPPVGLTSHAPDTEASADRGPGREHRGRRTRTDGRRAFCMACAAQAVGRCLQFYIVSVAVASRSSPADAPGTDFKFLFPSFLRHLHPILEDTKQSYIKTK